MPRPTARLSMIGAYPPPAGGLTKHVERLCALLRDRGVPYVVFNASSAAEDPAASVRSVHARRRRWLVWYTLSGREPVVYVLSALPVAWLAGAFMSRVRRKRVIIRLRNDDLVVWRRNAPIRYALASAALRRVDSVVAVSESLADAAAAAGVDRERILVSPGFLPPVMEQEEASLVDDGAWEFARAHRPLITATGTVSATHDGEPVYGFDHLVDLAAGLRADYPDVGVLVCLVEYVADRDAAALQSLQRRAAEAGARDAVFFNTSPGPFVPVLRASDVLVRPTTTDGDANSVREALYFGIPAVASDAVARPPGTILFRTRDYADMERAAREALGAERAPAGHGASQSPDVDRYIDFLLGTGERLL